MRVIPIGSDWKIEYQSSEERKFLTTLIEAIKLQFPEIEDNKRQELSHFPIPSAN